MQGGRRSAAGRRIAARQRRGGRAGAPLLPAKRRDAGTDTGGTRLAASAGPSPTGGGYLREAGRGARSYGSGEVVGDTAAASTWVACSLWISVALV